LELQGLIPFAGRARGLAAGLLVLLALGVAAPASAASSGTSAASTVRTTRSVTITTTPARTVDAVTESGNAQAESSGTPVLVTDKTAPPSGYRLDAYQVERIAAAAPITIQELHRHPDLVAYEYTKAAGEWQVSWFTPPGGKKPQRELLQIYVNDATGQVTQAWTGFQVAWTMARGYPGAFGRNVNAWWLWLPLCVIFVAPFVPWRRRPTLLHLDLLVLLGFSISLALFNHGTIGLSVPLVYPFLVYLLVRMLLLAFGRGRPREALRVNIPVAWMVVAIIFLVGFRVGLNVSDSNVIDVGYAGVIGADKIVHGKKLYGDFPTNNPNGDTYGPVNYYAYVPARLVFGWSGLWDSLPAAHAAAILFDLLTLLGLFFLGRRIRGPSTGVVLAYSWAAYPFTLYALSSNSNDSLVSALVVLCLLVITSAPARGVADALAGLTKFAPLALGPLLMRGIGPTWPRKRSLFFYVLAYAVTVVAAFLPVVLNHDITAFYHDSLKYQANRPAPFSVWGLWGGMKSEQRIVQAATIALAILVAFVPRRERTVVEVAALGAAVMIAVQLCLTYWFYLYIPWFFPLVMIALVCAHPSSPLQPAVQAYATGDVKPRGIPILSSAD
jgi:hypothetical protein